MNDAWFFMPHLPRSGESAELDPAEARHAHAARRLEIGDAITLFDGSGAVAHARIEVIAKRGRSVTVRVHALEERRSTKPTVHLAVALPKGDRQAVMLSMATQLGVRSVQPLECERSVSGSGERAGTAFRERARRMCIEACKQSRRPHLPDIHEPRTPGEAARAYAEQGVLTCCAHPGGKQPNAVAARDGSQEIAFLIGPEGGFTDREVNEMHDAGAAMITLGEGILRIETAAIALLAWARLRGG